MRFRLLSLAALAASLACGSSRASALRVSPVGFELAPGQNAATLDLQDEGSAPMTVQVRVFRWTQGPAGDVLAPTPDVVASPPFAELAPASTQTVRLVRLSHAAIVGEEAFRLLVDELPPSGAAQGRTVTLLMRHSIPLFVTGPQARRAAVSWRAVATPAAVQVVGTNAGDLHLRVADLRVCDAAGHVLAEQKGLVGYVLGGASASWRIARVAPGPGAGPVGSPTSLIMQTDRGRLDVALPPPPL